VGHPPKIVDHPTKIADQQAKTVGNKRRIANTTKIAHPPTQPSNLVATPTRKVTPPPQNTPEIVAPPPADPPIQWPEFIKDSSPPKTAVYTWKVPDGTFADWMSWKSDEGENNFLYSFFMEEQKKVAAVEKKLQEITGKEWVALDGKW